MTAVPALRPLVMSRECLRFYKQERDGRRSAVVNVKRLLRSWLHCGTDRSGAKAGVLGSLSGPLTLGRLVSLKSKTEPIHA
jgi:hypothetical protein